MATTASAFVPARLTVARQRRGQTKTRLAGLCGVRPGTVTRWERAETSPSRESVKVIAAALEFPVGYFYRGSPPMVNGDRPSFRALKSMTAGVRDRALGVASIAIDFEREIAKQFRLPPVDVPDLHTLKPEHAAGALREAWGIGVKPIRNMVHLLERHGIRVFSLNEEATSLHAFCLWEDDLPFVFSSQERTVERTRFNCAHELGHLVLHRHGKNTGGDAEKQANQFASAFLMPLSSVKSTCRYGLRYQQIVAQKKRWGVAAAALAYRLQSEEVGLLSQSQYKRIAIEISRRGRENEPDPISTPETSHVLRLVFRALRERRESLSTVARKFCLPSKDLDELTFGLGLSLVSGPSPSKPPGLVSRPKPTLRRVK